MTMMTHPKKSAVSATQFWVVGGEFRDTNFCEMSGPASAFGPFKTYDDAHAVWKAHSVDSRPDAHIRYSILSRASR